MNDCHGAHTPRWTWYTSGKTTCWAACEEQKAWAPFAFLTQGHGSVHVSQSRDTALLLGVLPAPQQG